mgnify:CR=1 FL=1
MMKEQFYPVNMKLGGRRCAIVGGGHIALRRAKALVAAGAIVTVIAPQALPEIVDLSREGVIRWIAEPFTASHIVGMFLVVCATDDEAVNRAAAWSSKATGALVNMVAPPTELSDFTVPAQAGHGQLLLTVSTAGASPELSRVLCRELVDNFVEVYGTWLDRLAPLRQEAQKKFSGSEVREIFWRSALDDEVMALVRQRQYDEAEARVKDAIARFRPQS